MALIVNDRYAGDEAWQEWFAICSVAGCGAENAAKLRKQVENAMLAQLVRYGFTVEDAERRKAFTISVGTAAQVKACDYLGCVSGNKTSDKVAKSGLHVTRSNHVDAPTIDELPLVFECEVVSMDPDTCLVIGKVVNVACDETALTDGKPDADKIAPITFDPVAHVYRPLAAPLAQAFNVGLE